MSDMARVDHAADHYAQTGSAECWCWEPDLLAALCTATGLDRDDLPAAAPYDQGIEERLLFVAETYDEETGRSRRLGPRRDGR